MMYVFDPKWTVDGPLDESPITFSFKEEWVLGRFQMKRESVKSYFHPLRKLVEKYPNSPFLLARLAVGHIFLDDVAGALDLFEKARELLGSHDPTFEEYFKTLRDFVKRNDEEEDKEWSQPEGTFIVSPHFPPKPISAYSFGAVPDDNVKAAWDALQSESFKIERYTRLLAVESNEIEHVFCLGGESLMQIVRAGFFTGAIDCVLYSPSGRLRPEEVVKILKNFALGLTTFTDILNTPREITVEDICDIHALLLKSSSIATTVVDGKEVNYLVPAGVYRRRLVTTTIDGTDGIVQFSKWKDIPHEMSSFMSYMRDCLLSTASPFVKAAWIHTVFVGVHPFTDGNGRVARIIASIPLVQEGLPFINIQKNLREEYIEAVSTAQTRQDLQPLAEVLVKSMEHSIHYITTLPAPSSEDKRWTQSHASGRKMFLF